MRQIYVTIPLGFFSLSNALGVKGGAGVLWWDPPIELPSSSSWLSNSRKILSLSSFVLNAESGSLSMPCVSKLRSFCVAEPEAEVEEPDTLDDENSSSGCCTDLGDWKPPDDWPGKGVVTRGDEVDDGDLTRLLAIDGDGAGDARPAVTSVGGVETGVYAGDELTVGIVVWHMLVLSFELVS